jgi:hypothetical protein
MGFDAVPGQSLVDLGELLFIVAKVYFRVAAYLINERTGGVQHLVARPGDFFRTN